MRVDPKEPHPKPMFLMLSGMQVHAGELNGDLVSVQKVLQRMSERGYSFAFFRLFDAVIGFGDLRIWVGSVGSPGPNFHLGQLEGYTFPKGECGLSLPTVVVDVANVFRSAADISAHGYTTSVEEVVAHELGHVMELYLLRQRPTADEGGGYGISCDEERAMHMRMYGTDTLAAEQTWSGCSH